MAKLYAVYTLMSVIDPFSSLLALNLAFPEETPRIIFEAGVFIKLPLLNDSNIKQYSKMLIVVQSVFDRREREFSTADIDGHNNYIAAEFPVGNIPNEFIVGDNKTYGQYHNPPLNAGSYTFFVGFVAKTEDEVQYVKIPNSTVTIGLYHTFRYIVKRTSSSCLMVA